MLSKCVLALDYVIADLHHCTSESELLKMGTKLPFHQKGEPVRRHGAGTNGPNEVVRRAGGKAAGWVQE